MNSKTVTIVIKGVAHYFNGSELLSPNQEAIIFLNNTDLEGRVF